MSRVYLHPLCIRIWHWINAFIIIVLIITGLQLRIPDIRIFSSYSFVTSLHKYMGYACTASFVFWLVSYCCTGGLIRHYILTFRDIYAMPKQAWYYMYGLFRGKKNPFKPTPACKFNPLQKIAYFKVMFFLTPVIIITGILFSDILYFLPVINAIGGIRVLDAIHVICGYAFFIYLMIHVYMATLGVKPYTHIKTMLTGYEEEIDEERTEPAADAPPDSTASGRPHEPEKTGSPDA